jgi:nicotinamidase-related amidase
MDIDCSETALVIIDIQERLAAVMPAEVLAAVRKNVEILISAAQALGVPVVVSEQYPKGLGPTLAPLAQLLPEGTPVCEKLEFSAMGAEGFVDVLHTRGAKHIILTGMEAHVCVLQTVIDLTEAGYHVWVLRDAVCSRTKLNWRTGLELAERAGAVVASTETVLLLLLGRAGTPEFKKISRLIK